LGCQFDPFGVRMTLGAAPLGTLGRAIALMICAVLEHVVADPSAVLLKRKRAEANARTLPDRGRRFDASLSGSRPPP